MISINKRTEPKEFTDCKEKLSKEELTEYQGDYNDLLDTGVKPALQDSLCKEQGYLCCYCMQLIQPQGCLKDMEKDVKCMRLEHFKCQKRHKDLKFEYSNMMAACHGFNRMELSEKHCDVKKGSSELKYSPAKGNIEQYISYMPDGTILSTDPEFDEQLNDVLSLNAAYLKNNRSSVRATVNRYLKANGWTDGNKKKLLADFEVPNSNGELKEYCGVAIYYLKKKLRQAK